MERRASVENQHALKRNRRQPHYTGSDAYGTHEYVRHQRPTPSGNYEGEEYVPFPIVQFREPCLDTSIPDDCRDVYACRVAGLGPILG